MMTDMLEIFVETNQITNRLSVGLVDSYNKELNTKNYKRQLVHFEKKKDNVTNKNRLKWEIGEYTVIKSLIIYEENVKILYRYNFDKAYYIDTNNIFNIEPNNLNITMN